MNNELIERIDKRNQAWVSDGMKDKIMTDCKAEIERLTKALEAKSVGEAVAWRYEVDATFDGEKWNKNYALTDSKRLANFCKLSEPTPLYTAPPNVDALIAEIDECVRRSNENLMPWDELQPFVYCETLNELLGKWRTK